MRLIKPISWVLFGGMVAFFWAASFAESTSRVSGRIVVAAVEGVVTATNPTDQTQRTLKVADVLSEHHIVTTGADARAILVFSNGATINLGADSVLSIDEFLQDPFSEPSSLADMKEEPSSSTTRLNLVRGELVGNVKHLRKDKGSDFIVATPVGAAGIRGTTFRILFRPDTLGHATYTLSTSDGTVLFEAPASEAVEVSSGKEVVVDVQTLIDTVTGKVTVGGVPRVSALQDMPVATQAAIAVSAQQIIERAANVILAITPPRPVEVESSPDNSDQKKAE